MPRRISAEIVEQERREISNRLAEIQQQLEQFPNLQKRVSKLKRAREQLVQFQSNKCEQDNVATALTRVATCIQNYYPDLSRVNLYDSEELDNVLKRLCSDLKDEQGMLLQRQKILLRDPQEKKHKPKQKPSQNSTSKVVPAEETQEAPNRLGSKAGVGPKAKKSGKDSKNSANAYAPRSLRSPKPYAGKAKQSSKVVPVSERKKSRHSRRGSTEDRVAASTHATSTHQPDRAKKSSCLALFEAVLIGYLFYLLLTVVSRFSLQQRVDDTSAQAPNSPKSQDLEAIHQSPYPLTLSYASGRPDFSYQGPPNGVRWWDNETIPGSLLLPMLMAMVQTNGSISYGMNPDAVHQIKNSETLKALNQAGLHVCALSLWHELIQSDIAGAWYAPTEHLVVDVPAGNDPSTCPNHVFVWIYTNFLRTTLLDQSSTTKSATLPVQNLKAHYIFSHRKNQSPPFLRSVEVIQGDQGPVIQLC